MTLFETILMFLFEIGILFGLGINSITKNTSIPVSATTTATVVTVIDGDTIVVAIDGIEETVRYIGIDTPEPRRDSAPECGSHEATAFNRDLVAGETVYLVSDAVDRDRYDRLLRYVYIQKDTNLIFVNQALIESGLARPLSIAPNSTHAALFTDLAATAKTQQRGLWSLCGS